MFYEWISLDTIFDDKFVLKHKTQNPEKLNLVKKQQQKTGLFIFILKVKQTCAMHFLPH